MPIIRFAAAGAFISWTALLQQLYLTVTGQMAEGHSLVYGVMMYLGYFTILTNLFCALVFTAYATDRSNSFWIMLASPSATTSAAAAIAVVGLIYHFLLLNTYSLAAWPMLVDRTMHYVVPVLFVLFWWLAVPRQSLRWKDLPKVSAYPAAYLVYYFIRGELTGLYPYFFMDVRQLGYAISLRNAAGVALLFFLICALFLYPKHISRSTAPAN